MSLITLSCPSYGHGARIAEGVASALGLSTLSKEVLEETAKQYHLSQHELYTALHDGPRLLERFTADKHQHVRRIKAILLKRLTEGNVVYHGLAGHYLVRNVPHVLKVRLLADASLRIKEMMHREQIPEQEAVERAKREDHERDKWNRYFCKTVPMDAAMYDLMLNVNELSDAACVEKICEMAASERFQSTEKNRQDVADAALSSAIAAELGSRYESAIIRSRQGNVMIRLPGLTHSVRKTKADISDFLSNISGINDIQFDIRSNHLHRTPMHRTSHLS
ncbi:MAG: hypothetical protein CSA22_04440 [Deltaproteobacteria bacterium]|nr:MAG: hypothetical protein CSA22_04440 [Deltaproteobacteria bacterium]